MRIIRNLAVLCALALGAAACEPDRIAGPEGLAGVWTDSIDMGQGVTWANTLSLAPGGGLRWEQATYGIPPYGPGVAAHRYVQHGRYRMRGGILELRVDFVEHAWAERETPLTERIKDPRWSGDLYRARLDGDALEVTYTRAPLDTPEEIRLTFLRKQD